MKLEKWNLKCIFHLDFLLSQQHCLLIAVFYFKCLFNSFPEHMYVCRLVLSWLITQLYLYNTFLVFDI